MYTIKNILTESTSFSMYTTTVHELPDAIYEECFQMHMKPCMHCILDPFNVYKLESIFKWSE